MKRPQNVNSAVPLVTALPLSVRLTLVSRAVPVEDAVWNVTVPHAHRAVTKATVHCSVRVRQRRARKVVQLTKTGAPKSISIFLSLMMRLGVEFLCLADVFYGESWV